MTKVNKIRLEIFFMEISNEYTVHQTLQLAQLTINYSLQYQCIILQTGDPNRQKISMRDLQTNNT